MKLIEFPEQTTVYAKDQPQYLPLPCHKQEDGVIYCCWSVSFRERLKILLTGKVWHSIMTFNKPLQPQLLMTEKPNFPKV